MIATTPTQRAASQRLLLLPAICLTLIGIASILYVHAYDLYVRALSLIMMHPFKTPFIDIEAYLTTETCWRRGVDVYVSNPCDQLHRAVSQSPLWLRFAFLDMDRSWSAPLGLGIAILFSLSLQRLPPTPSWRNLAVIGLAALSSVCIFAVERANVDVLIYLVALAAGEAMRHGRPVRLVAYAGLLLAGMLKFYPFVGLLSLVRERLRVFASLAILSCLAIALFFLALHDELRRMAANIPRGSVFSDLIGAVQLPGGINVALRTLLEPLTGATRAATLADSPYVLSTAVVLPLAFTAGFALLLIRSPENRLCVATLPVRAAGWLLIGAALLDGCFFAGQSIGYRGVLLLLVLPGLLCLDQPSSPGHLRLVARLTLYAILVVMFRLTVLSAFTRNGSWPGNSALAAIVWIGFEVLWWWIVAVLLGLLGCLLLESQSAQDARKMLSRNQGKEGLLF